MALPSSSPDGRRLRSERTKQSIMEAYIELLREKPEVPTAAQIAARAGISTRSVFERFVDLQGLSLATVDHAFARARRRPSRATSTATGRPVSGRTSRPRP